MGKKIIKFAVTKLFPVIFWFSMGNITACASNSILPDPVPRVVQPVRVQRVQQEAPITPRQLRNLDYKYGGNPYIPPVDRVDPELLKTTGYNDIWNQYGWLDYEEHEKNNPDVFHTKIDDYLFILRHTPGLDLQAVWRVENFLKSRRLYPKFRPIKREKREKNYYRIMWYILHSLPFYIRDYNQHTCRAISNFFLDVAITHPCNVCADHFEKYQRDNPWISRGLSDLVVWLCNLHNHLNTRLGKPWFDCTKYAKRWGIQIDTTKLLLSPSLVPTQAVSYQRKPQTSPQNQPVRFRAENKIQEKLLPRNTKPPYMPERRTPSSPDFKPSPSPDIVARRPMKRRGPTVPMFPE